MGLLMSGGDYVAQSGTVAAVTGVAEVLNEAQFRLTARRGSLPMLPRLGSRMYLLRAEKPSARQRMARWYAEEALEELSGLMVTDATVTEEGERLCVAVELKWQGELLTVECEA